jgi:hypothetical protein
MSSAFDGILDQCSLASSGMAVPVAAPASGESRQGRLLRRMGRAL